MSIARLLSAWRADSGVGANIIVWRHIPSRPARLAPIPGDLHPVLIKTLQHKGIDSLYIHQAAAWQQIRAGQNIIVVTGTASGKSLCYHLPVLDCLLRDPQARALYLFPTKALAQDQQNSLQELLAASGQQSQAQNILPAIYDGDTPSHARSAIRNQTRLLISNPDMLHMGILPHHTSWAQFFRGLQIVVLDEAHAYRGVFGSHIANLIRRLKRIAQFYGAYPQFILTSATIANPLEFASRLAEENFHLIDEDGAPRGERHFLIYNPPIVNPDLGIRRSALQESVHLTDDLLAAQIQTIIFARSRRSVELILTYLRQQSISSEKNQPADAVSNESHSIRGYRSGYLPSQRRKIEQGLRDGTVRAVVATNALELGIDIGQLDAALMVGYPGTIAATHQQSGRAGRGTDASLAVLIATADPLDQFLASHPEYLFAGSPENALINPDNLLILLDHLRCAAFELPFQIGNSYGVLSPEQLHELLDILVQQGLLHQARQKYFWIADHYPAQDISLRSASADSVALQILPTDEPVASSSQSPIIGKVDLASAAWMVHPQAIYMHEGQTFAVESLDLEQKIAWLRPIDTDYYTEPRQDTEVALIDKIIENEVPGAVQAYGEIQVTTQITGFRKVRWYTHEQIGLGELSLPPNELLTNGYWFALTESSIENLRQKGLWRNDPNDYGPTWPAQRQRARARDGYCCQVCGISEQGRSHDVHHKIPFRFFSSPEQANRLENLATLCPTCHRRAETAVRVRSGLAGVSFILGHLAPLFVMCDTSDLGVHADPQSPLSDGQPAVIIYDRVPAGIGLSQRLFELHGELMLRAYELVSACKCSDGCPACVGPGGENGLGGKQEAKAILEILTNNG